MEYYYCCECGYIFEKCDAVSAEIKNCDELGAFWDFTDSCPCCHSIDLSEDEAEQCEECGKWWYYKKLVDGICPDCLREKMDWKEIRVG